MAGGVRRWRGNSVDDRAAAQTWRATIRRRLVVACALFAVWAFAIEARLVHLQVCQYDELLARATRQRVRTVDGVSVTLDGRGQPLPRRTAVAVRQGGRAGTTRPVTAIVRRAVGPNGWRRLAPAVKTIRAFRIWVNREFGGLDRFLRRG
jgi:hypothetical protein